MTSIPAYLCQRNTELPPHGGNMPRCVVAQNGIFLERRTPSFSTSIRIHASDLHLTQHDEYCRLTCGKIPATMQRAMLAFFKSAFALHGGEAALVLLHDPQRKRFLWHCPEQVVDLYDSGKHWRAGDLIEYQNPLTVPPGYNVLGDAHSHRESPMPSTVDVHDDQDGLHIIVGNIESIAAYHCDFVMDGARFSFRPEAIFEQPLSQAFAHTPRSWLEKIRVRYHRDGVAWTRPLLNAAVSSRYLVDVSRNSTKLRT
jgi:hypothetical protein